MLMHGALGRMLVVALVLAALWAAVAWALS